MWIKTTRFIALAALIVPAIAVGDASIEMSSEQGDGSLVMHVKDGKTRLDQSGGAQAARIEDSKSRGDQSDESRGSVLFDSATRTMTILNHRQKTYMTVDKAAMQGMSARMAEVKKQMQAQLANMPPEQREMIMKRMPGGGFDMPTENPVITAEKADGTDKVNGIKCRNMRLLKDGQPFTEACVASADAMDIPAADFETLAMMFESMHEMANEFAGSGRALPLREMGGMPVRSVDVESGEVSQVTAVSDDELDGAMFEIPAGYRLQAIPKF